MKKVVIFILYLIFSEFAMAQFISEKVMDSIWFDFRTKYPNPYQTIGLAEFENSQLYIISEPRPDITLNDIEKIFDGFFYKITEKKWKIGHDGWVKDVLIVVDYIPSFYKWELIGELNQLLFGTAERSICMQLPVAQSRELFANSNLNYKITAFDFNQWLIDDSMSFINENSNANTTVADILQQSKTGIFYSNYFVLWALPKKKNITNIREEIRKFAIDADILLGAVADASTLIIIGRERQLPFAVLPPLRTETVEMLLAVNGNYLFQSLNIGDLLTGKMSNGDDWVPASLSKELENDEFGHILTLTDILLKDWLLEGAMVYDEYHYSKPPYYPAGFDKKTDSTTTGIRYNWNTDNFIYSKDFGYYEIYTLNNTGAINASLFDNSNPNDEKELSKDLEIIANNYFANLNNTDIARSVQYNFLYQMFKLHNLSYSYNIPESIDKSELLVNDARFVLNKIKNLTTKDIDKFLEDVAKYRYYNYIKLHKMKHGWDIWEKKCEDSIKYYADKKMMTVEDYKQTEEFNLWYNRSKQERTVYLKEFFEEEDDNNIKNIKKEENITSIREYIIDLQNEIKSINTTDFDKICRRISFPNGNYSPQDSITKRKVNDINTKAQKISPYYRFLGIDLEKIKDKYVQNLQLDTAMWMKTPKVVLTTHTSRKYDDVLATDEYKALLYRPTGGNSLVVHQPTPVDDTQKSNLQVTLLGYLHTPNPEEKVQKKLDISKKENATSLVEKIQNYYNQGNPPVVPQNPKITSTEPSSGVPNTDVTVTENGQNQYKQGNPQGVPQKTKTTSTEPSNVPNTDVTFTERDLKTLAFAERNFSTNTGQTGKFEGFYWGNVKPNAEGADIYEKERERAKMNAIEAVQAWGQDMDNSKTKAEAAYLAAQQGQAMSQYIDTKYISQSSEYQNFSVKMDKIDEQLLAQQLEQKRYQQNIYIKENRQILQTVKDLMDKSNVDAETRNRFNQYYDRNINNLNSVTPNNQTTSENLNSVTPNNQTTEEKLNKQLETLQEILETELEQKKLCNTDECIKARDKLYEIMLRRGLINNTSTNNNINNTN